LSFPSPFSIFYLLKYIIETMRLKNIINEAIPVGGGSFGANLGGAFWSKDKGAEGAKEDEEGLKSMRKTVNRLIKLTLIMKNENAYTK